MKWKNTLSVAPLLVAGTLFPQDAQASFSPEFIGYVNLGYIYTDSDERNNGSGRVIEPVATEGGFGHFRTGNEFNWYEIGLRDQIYDDGVTQVEAGWLLGNNTEDWSTIATQALYVAATGMFDSMPEARLWAGRRVDIKNELYQMDLKLWYNHFYSIGIDDLPLGDYTLDVAWAFPDGIWSQPKQDGGDVKISPFLIDIRAKQVKLASFLPELTFGLNYIFSHQNDVSPADYEVADSGLLLSLVNTHYWSHGENQFLLQFGTDALASAMKDGWGAVAEPHYFGLEHKGTSISAFYQGVTWFNDKARLEWSLGFEDLKLDNQYGKQWGAIALQPHYAWTDVHSTLFQFGYDQAQAQAFDRTNGTFKATIAQQMQPEVGVWSRPIFRVAASYVEQSHQWTDVDWNYGNPIPPQALIGGKTDEIVFGFTMEAWW